MSNIAKAAYQAGIQAHLRGEYAAADMAFRQALDGEPSNPVFLSVAAATGCRLGRYRDAELYLRRAITTAESTVGRSHPATAATSHNLVDLFIKQGRYRDAEDLCKRILAQIDPLHMGTTGSRTMLRLGDVCRRLGRPEEAEHLYRAALDLRTRTFGKGHVRLADALAHLAALYRETGRHDDARAMIGRAATIMTDAHDRNGTVRKPAPTRETVLLYTEKRSAA